MRTFKVQAQQPRESEPSGTGAKGENPVGIRFGRRDERWQQLESADARMRIEDPSQSLVVRTALEQHAATAIALEVD